MKRLRSTVTIRMSRTMFLIRSITWLLPWLSTLCCPCCHASSSLSSTISSAPQRRWISIALPFDQKRQRQRRTADEASRRKQTTTTTFNDGRGFGAAISRRSLLTSYYSYSQKMNGVSSLPSRWMTRPAYAAPRRKGDFPREFEQDEEYGENAYSVDDEDMDASFQKLGPVGQVVAGTIEIAVTTLLEYLSGFFGGYALGTLTGLPGFVAKPAPSVPRDAFWAQLKQRSLRMHGKSARWARNWAGISAAFGGFRVTTKVLRGGKEDEWSTILSSMAAGAFFARNEGPQAMLRGAVVYGGIMYLLSGNLKEKKEPFVYTEEKVDF